jgi:hypothetical protein
MNMSTHRRFELLARALLIACSLAGAPNMELGTVLLAEAAAQPVIMAGADQGE